MNRKWLRLLLFLVPIVLFSRAASGSTIPVGLLTYDVIAPGNSAQFDITNLTGPNSSLSATWPITTTVNLSSLNLTVSFTGGGVVTEPPGYFSLSLDGISWDGTPFGIGGTNPLPTQATLTGTFSPTTIVLFDGTTQTISPTFATTILPSVGTTLTNGDFAIINATTTSAAPVPEPSSILLITTGMLGLLIVGRKRLLVGLSSGAGRVVMPLVLIACTLLIPAAHAQKQTLATTPSSGTAGTDVNVTEINGWPAADVTASNITVTWSATCGGIALVTNTANSLKPIVAGTERVGVTIPATLASGIYNVHLSDSAVGDSPFSSTNCSLVKVTASSKILASCVPASSLGVIAPTTGPAPVNAIAPNGCWSCGTTGIQVVQLETGGGPPVPPASVPTAHAVNSCAGNPATGESVCVANNTDVYHLNSSNVVTTLTSGSNTTAGFSGGSCENCGVAINALNDQAVIAMGHTGGSGTALQTLDLMTNTFGTPFQLANHVSENVVVNPIQGGVLSLNERNVYDFISVDAGGNFTTEYGMNITSTGGEGDASAVDCNTGIAVGPFEFTNNLTLSDMKQAIFVPGAPGSWTAPTSTTTLIGSYSAGLSGAAVAPGSSDLGVVTGEFGGSSFAILKLPSTSGSGTPALTDYAFVPCITGVNAGLDPHTMTAYVSPNDGKSYTVFASGGPPPSTLAVVDMAAVLGRPRAVDGHTVIGDSGPGSCLSNGDGIVRFVATH